MKKSTKIILLVFTFLLPVFLFLVVSGFYTQLFYGNVHQNFTNSIRTYGPDYAMQSFRSTAQFMSMSASIFIISYIIIFVIYSMNLINKQMKTEEKVFWFILFIITIGIGMLFYFFKYIWKDNNMSSQQEIVEKVI